MPFKSKAQMRYFHAHKAELETQGVDIDEWDRETTHKLPERLGKTRKQKSTEKLRRGMRGKMK